MLKLDKLRHAVSQQHFGKEISSFLDLLFAERAFDSDVSGIKVIIGCREIAGSSEECSIHGLLGLRNKTGSHLVPHLRVGFDEQHEAVGDFVEFAVEIIGNALFLEVCFSEAVSGSLEWMSWCHSQTIRL